VVWARDYEGAFIARLRVLSIRLSTTRTCLGL